MENRWHVSSEFDARFTEKDEVIIQNVRLQSNAGWYIGAVEFYNFDELDFYSRDSEYYPNEELLKEENPHSLSVQEAVALVKTDRLYKRKMERKLGRR